MSCMSACAAMPWHDLSEPFALHLMQVSGNHRLDDNKVERARCVEAGREVVSSCLEGRPVGPLRVWPGGLAMSRTLGDHEVCPCAFP